jgi:hypothetical protein
MYDTWDSHGSRLPILVVSDLKMEAVCSTETLLANLDLHTASQLGRLEPANGTYFPELWKQYILISTERMTENEMKQ